MSHNILSLWFELLFASTLILLVAGIIALCLSRATAALRCRVWTLAMIGLLAFPILSLFLPQRSLTFLNPTSETKAGMKRSAMTENPEYNVLPTSSEPSLRPSVSIPAVVPPTVVPPVTVLADESTMPEILPLELEYEPSFRPSASIPAVVPAGENNALASFFSVGMLVWCGGMLAAFAFLLRSWLLSWYVFRNATLPDNPAWQREIDAISEKIGLRRTVIALICPTSSVPFVAGLTRQAVFLPPQCDAWDASQQRSVLVHELTHILRGDIALQMVVRIVGMLYWFQPLFWLAAWRIRIEREMACDDAVLVYGERPSQYASMLLSVAAALKTQPRSAVGLGISMTRRSRIEHRIRSILQNGRNRMPVGRKTALLLAFVAAMIVTSTAIFSPFERPKFFAIAQDKQVADDETKLSETVKPTGEPVEKSQEPQSLADVFRANVEIAEREYQLAADPNDRTFGTATLPEKEKLERDALWAKIDLAMQIVKQATGTPDEIATAKQEILDCNERLVELARLNWKRSDVYYQKQMLSKIESLKAALYGDHVILVAILALAEIEESSSGQTSVDSDKKWRRVAMAKGRVIENQFHVARAILDSDYRNARNHGVFDRSIDAIVNDVALSDACNLFVLIQIKMHEHLLSITSDRTMQSQLRSYLDGLYLDAYIIAKQNVEIYRFGLDAKVVPSEKVAAKQQRLDILRSKIVELYPDVDEKLAGFDIHVWLRDWSARISTQQIMLPLESVMATQELPEIQPSAEAIPQPVNAAPSMRPEVFFAKKRALTANYKAAFAEHESIFALFLVGDRRGTAQAEAKPRCEVFLAQMDLVQFLYDAATSEDIKRELNAELQKLCVLKYNAEKELLQAVTEAYQIAICPLTEVIKAQKLLGETEVQLVELFPEQQLFKDNGDFTFEPLESILADAQKQSGISQSPEDKSPLPVEPLDKWLERIEAFAGK